MNGNRTRGGEDWPGRDQAPVSDDRSSGGADPAAGSDEAEAPAMEEAQEQAAEERESERGYQ